MIASLFGRITESHTLLAIALSTEYERTKRTDNKADDHYKAGASVLRCSTASVVQIIIRSLHTTS